MRTSIKLRFIEKMEIKIVANNLNVYNTHAIDIIEGSFNNATLLLCSHSIAPAVSRKYMI